jgi:hypothetical protein
MCNKQVGVLVCRCLGLWVSGSVGGWFCGCLGLWMSGSAGAGGCGYPRLWVSRCGATHVHTRLKGGQRTRYCLCIEHSAAWYTQSPLGSPTFEAFGHCMGTRANGSERTLHRNLVARDLTQCVPNHPRDKNMRKRQLIYLLLQFVGTHQEPKQQVGDGELVVFVSIPLRQWVFPVVFEYAEASIILLNVSPCCA